MYRILSITILLVVLFFIFAFPIYAEEVVNAEMTIKIGNIQITGVYSGTIENGIPNGIGKFESQNSEGTAWYYIGDFSNGTFNGAGKTVWNGSGYEEGFYLDGELYNGKSFTELGEREYTIIDGEMVLEKGPDTVIIILKIVFIMVAVFGMICLAVMLGVLFRIYSSRRIKPELLNAPEIISREKSGLINKTIAVIDIFQGVLFLYKDRIEFATKKNVSVFMFSEIFAVRHQYKNIFSVILFSGEKHGIIVKPENTMPEWVDTINHQIAQYWLNSPGDVDSAVSSYKKSIINIYPTAALKKRNGTLFLYHDRIEFAFIKVRPMNPFTRKHLDRINYDGEKEPITIPLSNVLHVHSFNNILGITCLRIVTNLNKKYNIFMAPAIVINEWVELINQQRALYTNTHLEM